MGDPRSAHEALTTLHVQRARIGEAPSVTWVVERFSPLLVAQARYRLRGRMASICEPEDVVNDVWLTALTRLADLEPRAGRHTPVLLAFLGTCVLNRVNTLVMKHLRGKPRTTDDLPSDLPDGALGVVTRAVRAERKDAVLAAIDALDAGDRELVVLCGIEQQSPSEVAARLGIAAGTARVRLHRALGRLRAELPGSVFDELGEPTEAPDAP